MTKDRAEDVSILVERMADIGSFEMYRFAEEEKDTLRATVALSPDLAKRRVKYAIWRPEKDEVDAGSEGKIEVTRTEWGDEERAEVLRQITFKYEEDLRFGEADLEIALGDGDGDGDGDDDSDGDDDGDGDDDSDRDRDGDGDRGHGN